MTLCFKVHICYTLLPTLIAWYYLVTSASSFKYKSFGKTEFVNLAKNGRRSANKPTWNMLFNSSWEKWKMCLSFLLKNWRNFWPTTKFTHLKWWLSSETTHTSSKVLRPEQHVSWKAVWDLESIVFLAKSCLVPFALSSCLEIQPWSLRWSSHLNTLWLEGPPCAAAYGLAGCAQRPPCWISQGPNRTHTAHSNGLMVETWKTGTIWKGVACVRKHS